VLAQKLIVVYSAFKNVSEGIVNFKMV